MQSFGSCLFLAARSLSTILLTAASALAEDLGSVTGLIPRYSYLQRTSITSVAKHRNSSKAHRNSISVNFSKISIRHVFQKSPFVFLA